MQDRSTKSRIFNTALRLFAENGYEKVTVRDIAGAVGIKAASIYNHYESKEQILEACYNLWLDNRYSKTLTREQYEPVIRNGTKEEIIQIVNYGFEEHISENMFFALFLIYSRIHTDARAREIFINEMDNAMQYLKEIFDLGIEIGRLHPFNVPAVSLIILSAMFFTVHSATIHPDKNSQWYHAQIDFFSEFVRIVPFKY